MPNHSRFNKDEEIQTDLQQGLAAFLTFLTVVLGLAFVAWFHWALVMSLTVF